jgi:selenocysteine lyase/cysteine desulfurase
MEELRAEFPVLERIAYLNAGTNGPVPRAAVDAVAEDVRRQAEDGRGGRPFFEQVLARLQELRGRVAGLLGADPTEVALTASTTDGVNAVLNALDLGPGDEVLTSDEEHPGVLAPLGAARERRGIRVRVVPFGSLAREVTPDTRLVACSHVSWITGRVVDLAGVGVPVLLDGAQGLGAVPTDVRALACDFYAASGQKWLCGPNGIGYLYVRAELAARLPAPWPGYMSLAASDRPLDFELHDDARRFDTGLPASQHTAWALAALDTLERPGIERVQAYATELAARLAEQLAGRGARVAPRGRSTLVSWEDPDPPGAVERLREDGIVVRNLPGTSYVRASVGAWTGEQDVARLLAAALPKPQG